MRLLTTLPRCRRANASALTLHQSKECTCVWRRQETYNHCFIVSFAITLRTSDCGIPNCLAILAGVTPALKAARTAFCLPIVKVMAGNSVRLLSVFDGSGFLPRRCCSTVTATCNCSSSWSLRCLIAAGRSLGRICREDAADFSIEGVVGVGVGAACSRGGSVEKRLGIIGVIRSLPMWLSCRPRREGATDLGSQKLDFRALRGRRGADCRTSTARLDRPAHRRTSRSPWRPRIRQWQG